MGCVGSTIVGTSVGSSVGGSAVFVGIGCGVLVGMGASVGMSVGVRLGIGVLVVVGMSVFVGMAAALLRPLTEGFVPQSTFPLRHLVTSACKAAGSQALKKS
ncbi:MAG: hypothetical protein ACXW4M_07745 [Anaerolineales bacterium]